jgi:hypothetical protein
MAEEQTEKTPLEVSRDIISQLKEIEHYSRTNIEKLSEHWLRLEEEAKQKPFAERVNDLVSLQNKFQDAITSLIEDFEIECNRIENEGG